MWFVFEVDDCKIKDGDLFGPFNNLAAAESFAAGRKGDHAITEAVPPAAARIVQRFDDLLGTTVRLSVGGKIYRGEVRFAEIDRTSSSLVRVWLNCDNGTQEISIHVAKPYDVTSL